MKDNYELMNTIQEVSLEELDQSNSYLRVVHKYVHLDIFEVT